MARNKKPILFHYPQSIYSHRVLWYLWLRGIEYDECVSRNLDKSRVFILLTVIDTTTGHATAGPGSH